MRRSGFSLVELVLAIIIIAISLMSIPMLIGESSKSNEYSLIQESVMAARTKLGNILTFDWDNNSTVKNSSGTISAVVVVETQGDIDLNKTSSTSNYRRGHVHDVQRRRFDINNTRMAANIGTDANATINDIDDFNGTISTVALTGGSGVAGDFDYLNSSELNISTRVYFVSDVADYNQTTINFDFNASNHIAHTTNLKMIELSVKSAYSSDPFILRAFSANIGGIAQLHSEVK